MLFLRFLHPLHVFPGFGIYADQIAGIHEEGGADYGAGFECDLFASAGSGIAFEARRRFFNQEVNFDWRLYADDFVAEFVGRYQSVRFHKFTRGAHLFVGQRETISRIVFGAKPILALIVVKVFYIFSGHIGFLEAFVLMEGLFHDLAGDEIFDLALGYRFTLLHAQKLVLHYFVRLSVHHEYRALF